MRPLLLPCLLLLGCVSPRAMDLREWSVEQMPGGHVTVRDDTLVIEDAGGSTIWYREKLTAPRGNLL
jgi:hypothetical protein